MNSSRFEPPLLSAGVQLFVLCPQALLTYFKSLNVQGAVLVFLPGWNTIFALHRYLTNHPVFGELSWYWGCESQYACTHTHTCQALGSTAFSPATPKSLGKTRGRFSLPFLMESQRQGTGKSIFRPTRLVSLKSPQVIISTNIAESSITINDVVYVIDCAK